MWTKDTDLTEQRTIKVNGLPLTLVIEVFTASDEVDLDYLIESEDDPEGAAKLQSDLERGLCSIFTIKVQASCNGLEAVTGLDILGGCVVYDRKDFLARLAENSMIENAIEDFKLSIASEHARAVETARVLSKFLKEKKS